MTPEDSQPPVNTQPQATAPMGPQPVSMPPQMAQPQVIQPVDTHAQEVQARHDQSVKDYPDIHLADGECVISEVHRHPIGLFLPFATCIILIAVVIALVVSHGPIVTALNLTGALANIWVAVLLGILAIALLGLVMYIAYYIYNRCYFVLTNERVIENTQFGLLSHREQTVSLGSVGEASHEQSGILQYLFNYGSIRLSTIGDVADEDSYLFNYVRDPKGQSATISDAIENFKNNRPTV